MTPGYSTFLANSSHSRIMPSTGSTGLVAVSVEPDIRIFYTITPSLPLDPKKPVIVLSHSLSAATWLWDSFVEEFSTEYTIIRYDIRFHGHSPLSTTAGFDYEAGHTIDDLASDVAKLLDHLGIKQADAFVGLSIGGGIAVALASVHANRFRHFVVVGSRATTSPGDDKIWDERIALARAQGVPVLARQSAERWFNAEWRTTNPELVASIAEKVGTQSLEGYIANVAALRKLDLWPHAAAIKEHGDGSRVLFVVGEEDAAPVIDETRALAFQAGSEVVVVREAGHITHVQQPKVFFKLVKQVLEGR